MSTDFIDPPSATPSVRHRADLAVLLSRSSQGDERSFALLYAATAARVLGLAVRVVRDHAQAEEVAQEAYLEIWRDSRSYDPASGSAISWIMTIAHRRAVDRVRSARTSRARDASWGSQWRLLDARDQGGQEYRADEIAEVRRALATLSGVQRQALQLCYFGGHTHAEVAELLGLPLGTTKSRIRDGLRRLREALGDPMTRDVETGNEDSGSGHDDRRVEPGVNL